MVKAHGGKGSGRLRDLPEDNSINGSCLPSLRYLSLAFPKDSHLSKNGSYLCPIDLLEWPTETGPLRKSDPREVLKNFRHERDWASLWISPRQGGPDTGMDAGHILRELFRSSQESLRS